MPPPFGPSTARRSCQRISRSRGPRVNDPRRTTAPSRRATTSPLRRVAASSRLSCQPSHGLSTTSRLVQPLLGRPDLGGLFLGAVGEEALLGLVVVLRALLGLADALLGPGPLGAHPLGELTALLGVLPVGQLLLAAGHGPRRHVLAPRRRRTRRLDGWPPAISMMRSTDAVEKGPIVGDHDARRRPARRGTAPGDPGRRSRGRWSARRAGTRRSGPAGSRPGRPGPPDRPTGRPTATSRRSAGKPRSTQTDADPGLEVVAAEGQETVEGVAVGVDRGRVLRPGRPSGRSSSTSAAATPVRRAR